MSKYKDGKTGLRTLRDGTCQFWGRNGLLSGTRNSLLDSSDAVSKVFVFDSVIHSQIKSKQEEDSGNMLKVMGEESVTLEWT